MLLNNSLFLCFVAGLVEAVALSTRDPPPYYGAAENAFSVLQTWYDTNTGLWDTTNWWNAANCLTVIGNLLAVDGNVATEASAVFPNTFTQAQTTPAKLRAKGGMTSRSWSSALQIESGMEIRGQSGFLNNYYDDEAWWALAWIQIYDLTKEQQYLDMATEIFQDLQKGWTGNCSFPGASGGGVWWNKDHQQINSIANTLYLSVAAHLSNRQTDKQTYITIAEDTWQWLGAAGLQNSSNQFTDGLFLDSCVANGYEGWSYNQGVIVGGLVELASATGNTTYLESAQTIASTYITERQSTTGGIARDNCEPDGCSADQTQFKGIFMRNLAKLWITAPDQTYKNFIIGNADSIIAHDTLEGKLGLQYTGPFVAANASTQSSALDALVAAIVVSA